MQVIVHTFFWDSDAGVRSNFLAFISELFSGNGSILVAQKAQINIQLSSFICDWEDRAQKRLEIQAKNKPAIAKSTLRRMTTLRCD